MERSREAQPKEAPASSRVRRRWGEREGVVLGVEVVEKRKTPPEDGKAGEEEEGRVFSPTAVILMGVRGEREAEARLLLPVVEVLLLLLSSTSSRIT